MLFPQLGPQYYQEEHKAILSRMEAFYAESITMNQSFWGEADTDTRFFMGDQSVWNDLYGNLPANRRRNFNFNRIRRVINMISGHQRRNRKSTTVIPVENGDAETADQFTKIMLWLNQHEGVLETISEAFEGGLVTGMNLLHVWMDYRTDPISGNIKVDNCSYNSFLIDPFFKKADLSDCNAIWKRSYLTKRECISLMPQYSEIILGLQPQETGTRDSKFQFMPESYNYSMRNLMTYDEFWYRDYRKQKLLVDSQTGETTEWKSQDEDSLKDFLAQYPQITMIESEIPTVKCAVVVQGRVFYDGPNPMGIDRYPFVPVFAYYTPQSPYFPWRVQGVVRNLRDPQYLYNRRKIIELDILESQINSGWKYKEDALVNPKDVFLSGQGRGLALKAEALMTDAEQILPPQIPPSMIQLSEILAKEVQEISGVNEELLGSALDDKAGILSMLRQGAGLTTLQGLFDNLDRAQKILGGLFIDLIQANFTPGKVQKILENQQPTAQFYNKAFGKYSAAIEDGLNTTTQRQMQMAQLLQLREAGVPVPSDLLLETSTLQNKKELVEAVRKTEQGQAMMAENQAKMQMAQLQAQLELTQAQAHAAEGMGNERNSRIQENKALATERRAAAIKDQNQGLLDLVKAIKEIEHLDDDKSLEHIEKLVALANAIKEQQASTAEQPINNQNQGAV
jgi:hypothetical protein